MANDIFISYSRRDLEFVTQLHQTLTEQGLLAWFDKQSIEVADQWRTSIVEGIRDCKVFVLILSPDSAASVNVRKEVDLAEKYHKQIVPVMWRATEIPVAMEYQLAGIQYMDFKETASPENFNQLAEVLQRLMGGISLQEATINKPITVESTIPAIQKEEVAPAETGRKLGGGRKLGQKPKVDPVAIGGLIISSVVTTFGLDVEDQDFVNGELKWLFQAAQHILQIRAGEVQPNQPLPIPPPPDAAVSAEFNNSQLLNSSASALSIAASQITDIFERTRSHLNNLRDALGREADLAEAARGDAVLQKEIKTRRLEIVKKLQELAAAMDVAYGVRITSPNQLYEFLTEQ